MGAIGFISLLVVILTLILYYVNDKFNYWKKMGVPHNSPTIPYGSIQGIGTKFHSHEIMRQIYDKFKIKGGPFCGMFFYTEPVVLATSLDFVKSVLVKDAHNFIDRGGYYNEKDDPLSAHLFALDNPKWKILRAKLTPTFTSGKMKMMFPTVCDVGKEFIETLTDEAGSAVNNEMEIKDILGRFTTDVIGSCAFGLDCNSLKDPNAEFRVKSRKVFDDPKYPVWKQVIINAFRETARKLHIKTIAEDTSDFFMGIVKDTIDYREKNVVNRNDFMHLLIQLKNNGMLDDGGKVGTITTEEIAAQAFIFFLAGFETSSTALTYCLYELSLNQEVQEKARQSVEKVMKNHDNEFSYEAMMEMDYIENCINESLRKYPPVSNLTRLCQKDYQVEGTDWKIRKGQLVMIPAHAIQNDPEIYPNPDNFDPDRFTTEEASKRSAYSFLSFGLGPRVCIGLRFGMMQAKIGLAMLLQNFKFETCSKSVIPIEFDSKVFILTPKNGVWLKVTKIKA
ncbi:unnamed protein product [Diamesa serratosioi]